MEISSRTCALNSNSQKSLSKYVRNARWATEKAARMCFLRGLGFLPAQKQAQSGIQSRLCCEITGNYSKYFSSDVL